MKKLSVLPILLLLFFSAALAFAGGKQEAESTAKKPVSIRAWFTTRQPIVDMTQRHIDKFEADNS